MYTELNESLDVTQATNSAPDEVVSLQRELEKRSLTASSPLSRWPETASSGSLCTTEN